MLSTYKMLITLDYWLWCTSTYLYRINEFSFSFHRKSVFGGGQRLRMLTCEGWLDRGARIGGIIG